MCKVNKRAEMEGGAYDLTRKTVFWVIAGVMLVMAVLVYAYFLGDLDSRLTYISPKVYAEAISQRFVNIPECFAYQDSETKRVYPGVIDVAKFTEEQMNSCYQTDPEKGYEDYNFRIVLQKKKMELITNNYFNADEFTLAKKVLVRIDDTLVSDDLIIYVQQRTFYHPKVVSASD